MLYQHFSEWRYCIPAFLGSFKAVHYVLPNKNVKTEVSIVETKPAFAIVLLIFIPGSLLRACSPPVDSV